MTPLNSLTRRIEFIDSAKGLCIILVVYHHTQHYVDFLSPIDDVLQSFRMPLYFTLSGVFFKTYGNIKEFLTKKVNKLLIPFLFYFIFSSILFPLILNSVSITSEKIEIASIRSLFNEDFFNLPIWFLWCLFITNLMFYLINKICLNNIKVSGTIAFIIGLLGFLLGRHQINIPLYIDSAFVALPFFYFGHILKKSSFLYNYAPPFKSFTTIVILLTFLLLFAKSINFESNYYSTSYISLYACGIAGTIMILLIAKHINNFPFIKILNIIGRYSIIILCTHSIILAVISKIINPFIERPSVTIIADMLVVIIIETLIIIPIFRKYLPYVNAQKDLFQ